jgi:hypothetical protein
MWSMRDPSAERRPPGGPSDRATWVADACQAAIRLAGDPRSAPRSREVIHGLTFSDRSGLQSN